MLPTLLRLDNPKFMLLLVYQIFKNRATLGLLSIAIFGYTVGAFSSVQSKGEDIMSILELLRSDGSIVVNKFLARTIGLNESIILSELISWYLYYQKNGQLDDQNMFFCTVEKMEENTTFSKHIQSKAITKLEKLNLIEYKQKGLPAKRYFKICVNEISALFNDKRLNNLTTDDTNGSGEQNEGGSGDSPCSDQKLKNLTTGSEKNRQQEVKKCATSNTYYNTDLNNDDDEDIKGQTTFFQREFIEQAEERHVPQQEIQETLKELGDTIFQLEALDNTFDKVMPKYASGEVSSFPKYFVQVLKREQRRINYAHSLPKYMPEPKEPFPFYNWLET